MAHKAVAHHSRPGGFFDFRFGFRLRDHHVPLKSKVAALAIGVALTGVLTALELPLEALLGLFLPVLGLAADFVVDGLEFLVLPVLFASLILPLLTPAAPPGPG